jgi:divalent metal cation (Fe/Co/Zn/Cd) transporter
MGTKPNPTELRYSSVVSLGTGLSVGYLLADPITGIMIGVFVLTGIVAALQHVRASATNG